MVRLFPQRMHCSQHYVHSELSSNRMPLQRFSSSFQTCHSVPWVAAIHRKDVHYCDTIVFCLYTQYFISQELQRNPGNVKQKCCCIFLFLVSRRGKTWSGSFWFGDSNAYATQIEELDSRVQSERAANFQKEILSLQVRTWIFLCVCCHVLQMPRYFCVL